MLFRQLMDKETSTYTYLLADEDTQEAILIDPVLEQVDRDTLLIEQLGLNLVYILETHVHADHITGAHGLRERFDAKTVLSENAGVNCADINAGHGEVLEFGKHRIEIRLTPGHTAGCQSFVVRNGTQTMVFTGDALFVRGCGRTDFQQGSAKTLYQSVHEQIFSLADSTLIYPGHDYKGNTVSTVKEERAFNPRLNTTIDEAGFVAIMKGLNLSYPKKIKESLPANMACGKTNPPQAEA
jgi:sulfur dioxygenase